MNEPKFTPDENQTLSLANRSCRQIRSASGWQIPFSGIAAASGCRVRRTAPGGFRANTTTWAGRTTACSWVSGMSGSGSSTSSKPAHQRWSKRELQRQIDAARLFERVALSSDTRALVNLEKEEGADRNRQLPRSVQGPVSAGFPGADRRVFGERPGSRHHQQSHSSSSPSWAASFCFIRRQYPMRVDDEDERLLTID